MARTPLAGKLQEAAAIAATSIRLRRGKVHFAGEHTSQDFQGYLNGGVETGERAASEILADSKAGITP